MPIPDETVETVAVYYIHQHGREQTHATLGQILPEAENRRYFYFSSWGRQVRPTSEYHPCAHYLTPLDSSFRKAVVVRNAIALPRSRSLSIVLGAMLARMAEGAEIYIQCDPKGTAYRWVDSDDIRRDLPSVKVAEAPDGKHDWIRLTRTDGINNDLKQLGGIYPTLCSHVNEFFAVLSRSGYRCADPLTDHANSAQNAFCYSMHWTLHTMSILDKLPLGRSGLALKGMDIGGSYGFLACELAAHGHHMTNLELDGWKIEQILPWLADCVGVSGNIRGIASRMESLQDEDGSYDFILLMGSLLCIPRSEVPVVLENIKRLLKPDGIVVLRENLLIDATKDQAGSQEIRFSPEELHGYLTKHLGQPRYYCHLGVERSYEEFLGLWTAFAVVGDSSPPDHASAAGTYHAGFLTRLKRWLTR